MLLLSLCHAWLRVAREARAARGQRGALAEQGALLQREAAAREREDLRFRDALALRAARWVCAFGYQAWLATCLRGWREARARERHEQAQEEYRAEYTRLAERLDRGVARLQEANDDTIMRVADYSHGLQARAFAGTLCMAILHAWRQAQLIHPRVHQLRLEQGRKESHRHGALVGIFVIERLLGPREHASLLRRVMAAFFVSTYSAQLRGEFQKTQVGIHREIHTTALNSKVIFNKKASTILRIYDSRWVLGFLSVWFVSWRRETVDALRDSKLNAWRESVQREATTTVDAMRSETQVWIDKAYREISKLASHLLVLRCLPRWRLAAVAGMQKREMDRAREQLGQSNAALRDGGRHTVREQSSKVGGFVTAQFLRRARLLRLSLHALAWQSAASAGARARRVAEYRAGLQEAQQRSEAQVERAVDEKELAVSRAAVLLLRERERLELARPLLAWQRTAAGLRSSATVEHMQKHHSETLLELSRRHAEGIKGAQIEWQRKCQSTSLACVSFEGKMLLYRCAAAWSREVKAMAIWRLTRDYEALTQEYEDLSKDHGHDHDGAQDREPGSDGGPAAAGVRDAGEQAPPGGGPAWAAPAASGSARRWNAGAPELAAQLAGGGATAGGGAGGAPPARALPDQREQRPPFAAPPRVGAAAVAALAAPVGGHGPASPAGPLETGPRPGATVAVLGGGAFGGAAPAWTALRLTSAPPSDEEDEQGVMSPGVADTLARLTRARVAIGDHEVPKELPRLPDGIGGVADPVVGGYASALPPMPELPFERADPDALSASASAMQARLRSLQKTM
ncbi:unnamed protein product, partial [Prorocentrum cordatum]